MQQPQAAQGGSQQQLPSIDTVLENMRAFLSGNNQLIKQAQTFLKKYSKIVDSLGTFSYIISNSPDMGLRQLAGILIKRHILNLYQELNPQQQNEFKQLLLQRFFLEPATVIKRQIGSIIGSIAQITLDKG